LADIAAEASVSLATVSRVLNGRPGIADATRQRVLELLRDHGYQRRESEGDVQLVEVVCSELDSWMMELLQGVEETAQELGYSTMLTETGHMRATGRGWVQRTIARRPAAVIVVFAGLSVQEKRLLRAEGIPFIALDPVTCQDPDVPAVGAANWFGGLMATAHLIKLGHRAIGVITGPQDMLSSRARLAGYRTALSEAGIPDRPELIAVGDYHKPLAITQTEVLLDLADPPTAIFALNDVQAFGVYEAAARRGIRIPDELSVVGFDDLEISELADPPLTTVRQPLREMAEMAVTLVLDRRRRNRSIGRLDLATSLIVRESTGAVR
jgi:LacI family xylobiose transport system transcriptional regulator